MRVPMLACLRARPCVLLRVHAQVRPHAAVLVQVCASVRLRAAALQALVPATPA